MVYLNESFTTDAQATTQKSWLVRYRWMWIGLIVLGWVLAILFLTLGLTGVLHADSTPAAANSTTSTPIGSSSTTGQTVSSFTAETSTSSTGTPSTATDRTTLRTLPPIPTTGSTTSTMIDCTPDIETVSAYDCLSRGCHWKGRESSMDFNEPACVYPQDYPLGYRWENEEGENETVTSTTDPFTRTLTLQNSNFAVRRGAYQKVRLQITPIDWRILRISIFSQPLLQVITWFLSPEVEQPIISRFRNFEECEDVSDERNQIWEEEGLTNVKKLILCQPKYDEQPSFFMQFAPDGDNGDPAGNYTVPCFLAPWSCNVSYDDPGYFPNYSYEVEDTNTSTVVRVRRGRRWDDPDGKRPVIWSTEVGPLVFAHQYREITTKVASEYVYGSGENSHNSFERDMNYQTYGMWARDQKTGDRTNLYGVHPYIMVVEDDEGHAFGSLLLNSNAMEMTFSPTPAITYRTVGGHLDFFLFIGDDPEEVSQTYHSFIGRPFLPPYWALGFQLSRYGYNTFEKMEEAVERTLRANIPLDVFYGDTDYFINETNFLIDEERFGQLPEYVQRKLVDGLRFVTILDPIVPALPNNKAFQRGLQKGNAFVRWPEGYIDTNNQSYSSINSSQPSYLLGHVWPPAKSVFTDFFHPDGRQWWSDEVELFHSKINFSALWIDMNEPASFGTNGDDPWYSYSPVWPWSLQCSNDSALEHPQYIPGAVETGRFNRLSQKTICMDAVQSDGENSYSHYNVHSLYGHSQIQPSHSVMQRLTDRRSFVVSRSTFPGSGAKAGHSLGDNAATWEHMAQSIVGMLEFNLFGIPYVGADICGFFNNATSEMCARWHQLGAFYPFARNHNSKDLIEQDPAGMDGVVLKAAKDAMDRRYRLLPFLYTEFMIAHIIGGTVVKSLMEVFPSDLTARTIDKQFMWGRCLLVTPVLSPNATEVTGYFPEGDWYDYVTGENFEFSANGTHRTVSAKLDQLIPLHVRGGCIVPLQSTGRNTEESKRTGYTIGIAPANSERSAEVTSFREIQKALGDLVWEGEFRDGDELTQEGLPNAVSFDYKLYEARYPDGLGNLRHKVQGYISISWDYHGEIVTVENPPTIETILIAGFPGDIDVQHVKYEFDNLHDHDEPPTQPPQYLFVGEQVHQDKEKNILRIHDVNFRVDQAATIEIFNYKEHSD